MDLFSEPQLNELKARRQLAASFINAYCKVEDYTLVIPPYLMDYVHGDLFINKSPQKDITTVAALVKAVLRLRSTSLHISPSVRTVEFVAKLNETEDAKSAIFHALGRSRKQKQERDTVFRNLSELIVSHLDKNEDGFETAVAFCKAFPNLVSIRDVLLALSKKSFKDFVVRKIMNVGVHPLKAISLVRKKMYSELVDRAAYYPNHPLHGKVKETADYILKVAILLRRSDIKNLNKGCRNY
ncbi:hypothetical protein HDU76_010503 [Blyttiomyces sp. JEL0837]|nr:hypothetical protein HDU76_010503 [Blyttiomyces sp. JEL0837]